MKISELRNIIREEISVFKESQNYDIIAVIRSIREFNRGNINLDMLVKYTIKDLGFKPTLNNITNVKSHFLAIMDPTDWIPQDKTMVRELYQFLK